MTPTKYSKLLLGILFPQQIVPMQCPITMVLIWGGQAGSGFFSGRALEDAVCPRLGCQGSRCWDKVGRAMSLLGSYTCENKRIWSRIAQRELSDHDTDGIKLLSAQWRTSEQRMAIIIIGTLCWVEVTRSSITILLSHCLRSTLRRTWPLLERVGRP